MLRILLQFKLKLKIENQYQHYNYEREPKGSKVVRKVNNCKLEGQQKYNKSGQLWNMMYYKAITLVKGRSKPYCYLFTNKDQFASLIWISNEILAYFHGH